MQVFGPSGDSIIPEAVVDTGYTEYLMLSEDLALRLGLPYLSTEHMELADESIIPVDIHSATVEWDGVRRAITVDVSPKSAILVGMSMMYGRKIYVHVIDGGEVRIEAA